MLLTSRRSEFRGARKKNKRRDFIFRLFIWRQRTTTFYLAWIWSKKRFDFFVTADVFTDVMSATLVRGKWRQYQIKSRVAFNLFRFPLFHCAADEAFRIEMPGNYMCIVLSAASSSCRAHFPFNLCAECRRFTVECLKVAPRHGLHCFAPKILKVRTFDTNLPCETFCAPLFQSALA